jgi:hypothetical protein
VAIYAYECPTCWRTDERILPSAERDTPQACECGAQLTRIQAGSNFRLPGGNPRIDYEHAFNSDLYGRPEADAIKKGRAE